MRENLNKRIEAEAGSEGRAAEAPSRPVGATEAGGTAGKRRESQSGKPEQKAEEKPGDKNSEPRRGELPEMADLERE